LKKLRERNVAIPIALCMAVAVLEGFDIQAMGISMPRLVEEVGVQDADKGILFSINNVGMVLGAMVGGWLADRVGRKPVLVSAVVMFGLFTLAVVVSRSYETLLIARLFAGLGFGAALPNMMAIASESSPPERRAFTATLVFCGLPLGGGSVALLGLMMGTALGWRSLFIVGGLLPLILAPALYKLLPETLTQRAGHAEASRVGWWKALFSGGRAGPTVLLWLAFLPTLLILYLLLNWLPSLAKAKGLPTSEASVAFNFASVAGALMLGWLVDRFGPRWPLTLAFGGLVGALIALGAATQLGSFVIYAGVAGFFLLGANYALYGVAPVYYPVSMRGTGSGASVAVGRIGSVLGPLAAGLMLSGGSSATNVLQYMAPIACIAGIAVLALSFFRPRQESQTPAPR
jgi:MFS transporter, AAHS family, 3-hydroxyphenylpropionic acid transporter